MAIGGILPLPNLQLNDADDAAQMHRLTSPVPRLATAEGEKLRPGGRLRLGAFVAAAAASIRGLQPILLSRFHAMSAILMYPSSCSFPVLTVLFSDEEPVHAPIMVVVSRCAPGSPQSILDFDPAIRRHKRQLKAGGTTGRRLNSITVEGPG